MPTCKWPINTIKRASWIATSSFSPRPWPKARKRPRLHLKLGNAYEEAQKFGQAVAQWRMVLDLEPDHPQRMNLLNLIDKYRNETPMKVVPKAEKEKGKATESKKK